MSRGVNALCHLFREVEVVNFNGRRYSRDLRDNIYNVQALCSPNGYK